ncbi:hypothetical protein F5883DRAFT_562518, partial [Diaporthe sp. PMI_573]
MADTDLIAQIYPFNDPLYYVQKTINASSRFMPPRQPQQRQDPYGHSSRESTEALEEYNPETLPYIELRFSGPPRTSSGLVFGTDPNTCDVVLPSHRKILEIYKWNHGRVRPQRKRQAAQQVRLDRRRVRPPQPDEESDRAATPKPQLPHHCQSPRYNVTYIHRQCRAIPAGGGESS